MSNGHKFYTGLRYVLNDRYILYGHFDYLERFDEVDGKLLGGVSTRLTEQLRLSESFGITPDSEMDTFGNQPGIEFSVTVPWNLNINRAVAF
jgi:hypothetical protein